MGRKRAGPTRLLPEVRTQGGTLAPTGDEARRASLHSVRLSSGGGGRTPQCCLKRAEFAYSPTLPPVSSGAQDDPGLLFSHRAGMTGLATLPDLT